MIVPATLTFLKNLQKNNNKPWFDAHRSQYEAAKANFIELIQAVIDKHSKKDTTIADQEGKNCIFRINRDIRFSKDKTPYKKNFAASIDRGGKKSIYAGYYFHLEPGKSFIGGGIWMPAPAETKKVRQEIDYCFDEFSKIINSRKFKSIYGDLSREEEGISLSKVPQGFEKDNPAAEYLKLKSWIALKELTDAEVTSKNLVKQTTDAYETLQPLLDFINRAIE